VGDDRIEVFPTFLDGRTNLGAALQVLLENEWMQKQLAKLILASYRAGCLVACAILSGLAALFCLRRPRQSRKFAGQWLCKHMEDGACRDQWEGSGGLGWALERVGALGRGVAPWWHGEEGRVENRRGTLKSVLAIPVLSF
jgi:hypothetical protein